MKITGKPQEVANQIMEKLDTYKEDQEYIINKIESKAWRSLNQLDF